MPAPIEATINTPGEVEQLQQRDGDGGHRQDERGPCAHAEVSGQRRVAESTRDLSGAAESEGERGGVGVQAAFDEQRHQVDDRGEGGERGEAEGGRDGAGTARCARRGLGRAVCLPAVVFDRGCRPGCVQAPPVREGRDRGEGGGEDQVGGSPSRTGP